MSSLSSALKIVFNLSDTFWGSKPSKADECFCKNFVGNWSRRLKFIPAIDSSRIKSSSRGPFHFPESPLEAEAVKSTKFDTTDELTDSEADGFNCGAELPPRLEREDTSEAVRGKC